MIPIEISPEKKNVQHPLIIGTPRCFVCYEYVGNDLQYGNTMIYEEARQVTKILSDFVAFGSIQVVQNSLVPSNFSWDILSLNFPL